jgi:hypothetical protein
MVSDEIGGDARSFPFSSGEKAGMRAGFKHKFFCLLFGAWHKTTGQPEACSVSYDLPALQSFSLHPVSHLKIFALSAFFRG